MALDKEDYKDIGGLQEAVQSLNKAVDNLNGGIAGIRAMIEDDRKQYVTKGEFAEVKTKTDYLYGKGQLITGALLAASFILNFLQNGGLDSLK